MEIVSISDYAIKQRIGRSEPTGDTYTTRFGNTRHKYVFKEFYQTNMGEFVPEKWLEVTLQLVKTIQETRLLEEIKDYVKRNCYWLKKANEVEEYAINCLLSGAYIYWYDFKDKKMLNYKIFLFDGGDL